MRAEQTATLRNRMRERRRGLSNARQTRHSLAAAQHIGQSVLLSSAIKKVAVYLEFDGELPTGPLISKLRAAGKQLFVPIVAKNQTSMHFAALPYPLRGHRNRFGILEPRREKPLPLKLDAIIVPLTVFDACGRRLGMGAGFYDRYLGGTSGERSYRNRSSSAHRRVFRRVRDQPLLVGLGHECQRVSCSTLPNQVWDVPMDYLLSNRGLDQSVHRRR